MPFRYTYQEVREMVRRAVLTRNTAQDIVRKSGFRPGGDSESKGGPILSIAPTIAEGCPKPPYDANTVSAAFTPEQRDAFYATVSLAETGDAGALEDMREYLIQFNLKNLIVMEGVMPLLGYDYAGEVWTYHLDDEAGCPIEVDITPPANGFWEQYKDGDTRFPGANLHDGQDFKLLVEEFFVGSEAAQLESDYTNLNAVTDPPGTYPECFFEPGGLDDDGVRTHAADELFVPTDTMGYFVTAWRANYGPTDDSPIKPDVTLTNDRLMDNKTHPEYEVIGTEFPGAAPFGVFSVHPELGLPFPNPGSGRVVFNYALPETAVYVDSAWRACAEPVADLDPSLEHFCIMRSPILLSLDEQDETTTYRDLAVNREPPTGRQMVDWSIPPTPPDVAVERYNQTWPVFDVVAVRMA